MSYTLVIRDIHHIHKDVLEIARYLNQRSSGLGSDFAVAFDATLARLEERLGRETQVKFKPKFDDIYGEPIEAEKDSPVSAKKFRDFYVFYMLNEKREEAVILAVEYGPRNPDYLRELLSDRKANDDE